MSRIGKQPIQVPSGVTVKIDGQKVRVEGPKGKLERHVRPEITIEMKDGTIFLTRTNDEQQTRAYHGLERSLVNNLVVGTSQGYEKILEINGVGYRAEVKGRILNLGLGFSHPIDFPLPDGVEATLLKEGRGVAVKLESADKALLGQVAAEIRGLRPPEPYKGKGVCYRGETIRRKAGKAGKK